MRKRILSMLLCIMLCVTILPMMAFADANVAYAVFNDDTLTFYYGQTKPDGAYDVPNLGFYENAIPWFNKCEAIKKVVFDSTFKNYKPTSTRYWFYSCVNLVSVENANYLDTSSVTDMEYMFEKCINLTTLDVSTWDTSSVCRMGLMFENCKLLESLDVSGWDTSSVTSMYYMFSNCTNITTLDVSKWDTSDVIDMRSMFYNCQNLTTIDLSGWDISSAMLDGGIGIMFFGCSKLETIYVSNDWNLSDSVKAKSNDVFYGCTSLTGGAGTVYNDIYGGSRATYDANFAHIDGGESNPGYFTLGCPISFDIGEGVKGEAPESVSATTGDRVTLPSGSSFSKSDYKFVGWSDGNKTYAPGEIYTVGTSKVSFKAIWEEEVYTLSFTGGDGDIKGTAPTSITANYMDFITLPENTFTRAGYKFIGWSDGKDIYVVGNTYVVRKTDVTFEAQWELLPTPSTEPTPSTKPTPTTVPGGTTPTPTGNPNGGNGGNGNGSSNGSGNGSSGSNSGSNGGSNSGSNGGSGVVIPTPTTPPAPKPTGNATKSAGEFVERCYNVCLGRSSDAEGYKYWLDMLNSGDSCGAEVGYGFVFSTEYILKNTSNEQFVKDMYSMFFGREADAEGFNSWVEQLNNGASRLQVYAGFAGSPEFTNLCSEYGVIGVSILNDDAINEAGDIGKFVGRLYKICLSRYPDYCGFTAWTKGLQEGSKTGSTCAYGFIFSGEFLSRGLSNEEFVVYMYKVFFDREADEAGYNLWVGVLNNGGSYEEVFNGFTGSPEFANLCASYGINA